LSALVVRVTRHTELEALCSGLPQLVAAWAAVMRRHLATATLRVLMVDLLVAVLHETMFRRTAGPHCSAAHKETTAATHRIQVTCPRSVVAAAAGLVRLVLIAAAQMQEAQAETARPRLSQAPA
tara:strand:- start:82 stop:453 length:372 start_codon:yes stop_codon:yes gene_type:complete